MLFSNRTICCFIKKYYFVIFRFERAKKLIFLVKIDTIYQLHDRILLWSKIKEEV